MVKSVNRSSQIIAVIEDVVQQRRSGLVVDDFTVKRAHLHLMPELGDSLRALRDIEKAVGHAETQSACPKSGGFLRAALDEDLEVLTAELADYKILERLESGGQGVVYRARELPTDRIVAIKVLLHGPFSSDGAIERFSREVELASRMHHPNIVTLFHAAVVRGRPYYVMEYVEGDPIHDYVLLKSLETKEVVLLFIAVCRAVSSAHQRGVIHRDLKPSNILVDEAGEPHILDFGFAKHIDSPPNIKLSASGQVVGTIPYMSPEQARGGSNDIDVRSDIYALGVVLYELLTDALPFSVDGDRYAIRERILSDEPLPLRRAVHANRAERAPAAVGIEADLENIIQKTLAKDKVRRYQSADALADDLQRFLAGDPVEARGDSRAYLLRKTLRRYRVHATVAGGFIGLLVIFAATVSTLLVQTRWQRDRASQIAHLAHTTFNDIVTEFNEAVMPLPGGKQVRDRLTESVSVTLPRLQEFMESSQDPNLDDVLAVNYRNQGDILYEEGRHADAEAFYRASLETSTKLLERDPENPGYLRVAAMAHRRLGRVVTNYETHYARAIEIEEELLQTGNVTLQPDLELCAARTEFGRRLYLDGRLKQADEALAIAQVAAESNRQHTRGADKWRRLLADIYALRGKAKSQLGEASVGLPLLEKSVTIRNALIEQRPADAEIRIDLIKSIVDIGEVYRQAGQRIKAIHQYELAAENGRLLLRLDPTESAWRRVLFAAVVRLAQELLKNDQLDRAEVECKQAVLLAESLVAADPKNPEWLRSMASAHEIVGKLRFRQETWESAFAEFAEEAKTLELIHQSKTHAPSPLPQMASAFGWLAKCSKKLGDSSAEGVYARRAYEICRELAAAHPDALQSALDLATSQINLGSWQRRQRTETHAQQAYELLVAARDVLEGLGEAGRIAPDHPMYVSHVASIERNLELLKQP